MELLSSDRSRVALAVAMIIGGCCANVLCVETLVRCAPVPPPTPPIRPARRLSTFNLLILVRSGAADGACSEDKTAGTTMTFCSFVFLTLEGLGRHMEPPTCVTAL